MTGKGRKGLLTASGELSEVADAAGHAAPDATRAYDEAPDTTAELVPAEEVQWLLATSEGGAVEKNPAAYYLASLPSRQSKRTQGSALKVLAGMLVAGGTVESVKWELLRAEHTAALRAALVEKKYAPQTTKRMLAALRGVLKACWRLRMIDQDTFARACDIDPVRGSRLPSGRALSKAEVLALFRACPTDERGLRDRAMLALLFAGGLRRQEVADLRYEDIDVVPRMLTLIGKGDKQRRVPIAGAIEHVMAWVRARGAFPGKLLVRFTPHGAMTRHGLSVEGVYYVLRELGERCGVKFTPHDGRRTRLTELLDSGVDIAQVQRFAGHANIATTQKYDRRDDVKLAESVARVGFEGGEG